MQGHVTTNDFNSWIGGKRQLVIQKNKCHPALWPIVQSVQILNRKQPYKINSFDVLAGKNGLAKQ